LNIFGNARSIRKLHEFSHRSVKTGQAELILKALLVAGTLFLTEKVLNCSDRFASGEEVFWNAHLN